MSDPEWQRLARAYGPHALLAVLAAFMGWVRTRPTARVITDSSVAFSGNDPWYHARIVNFAVRNFPATPNFDAFSYFPYGTGRHSGFGGLFDQLIALAALVTGLADPSPRHIEIVTAYAPVVFGAVTVLPVYVIARRLMDRWSALLPAILLALVNGQFLTRTLIGVSDHQSAEAFFGALAVLGLIYALDQSYLEQPTWADIEDRNWRVLRRPTLAGILGGIAIASYLMMWPPGVFIVFTFGVFVVVQLARDHLRGTSLEYLTFATTVAMGTATVLTLVYAKRYSLEPTAFSLLQPLVLAGIALGALALWAFSERFRDEGWEPRYYPPAVGALVLASLGVTTVIYPPAFGMLRNLVVRIYSFGLLTSPSALTVAEISPATVGDAWQAYGALFPIAIVGFLVLAYRVVREDRPVELLVVLWSLTITSAYFTMVRFGYYFGVTVALLAGYAIWWTMTVVDLDELRDVSDLETYQVLVVIIVVVAVAPGTVVAVGGTSPPVWQTAERLGGTNTAWQDELAWVNDNTPPVPMDYYGRYDRPDDGDFAYPDGAYGVMSWWDYGHWITYTGQRIPAANPFQEGPRPASAYLLAENETRANLILEALPSRESRGEFHEMSTAELRATVDAQSPQQAGEDVRYVVIDDQMAAGKFSAIATWTGP
ncbi:MAG: oligosaccharyl transferase, archaeosortase A system-associated, partial [Halobacteriales archaeon]|nr:oligosaccharyl transferase, archaeosortase A system-associated [Halobacteriales archaeon]